MSFKDEKEMKRNAKTKLPSLIMDRPPSRKSIINKNNSGVSSLIQLSESWRRIFQLSRTSTNSPTCCRSSTHSLISIMDQQAFRHEVSLEQQPIYQEKSPMDTTMYNLTNVGGEAKVHSNIPKLSNFNIVVKIEERS